MMNQIICHCKQVTKAEIENAIQNGAKTLKDIKEITGACTGKHCKEFNPSGVCCSGDINAMLNENVAKGGSSCCCCK